VYFWRVGGLTSDFGGKYAKIVLACGHVIESKVDMGKQVDPKKRTDKSRGEIQRF
jgi:hypothetical protein